MGEYEFIRGGGGYPLRVAVKPNADNARMRANVILLKKLSRKLRRMRVDQGFVADAIDEVLDSLATYKDALRALETDELRR